MKYITLSLRMLALVSCTLICGCAAPVDQGPSEPKKTASSPNAAQASLLECYDKLKVARAQGDKKTELILLHRIAKLQSSDPSTRSKSLETAKEALALAEKVHGADSVDLLPSLAIVEGTAVSAGDRQAMDQALERELALTAKHIGTQGQAYMWVLARWAGKQSLGCGEPVDLTRLEKLAALQEKFSGKDSSPALQARFSLAVSLANDKKYGQSEKILLQLIEPAGKNAPSIAANAMMHLGKVRLKQGKVKQARATMRDTIAACGPGGRLRNPVVYMEVLDDLGFSLYTDKDYSGAAKTYKVALEELEQRRTLSDSHFDAWLERYMMSMAKVGKGEEARKFQRRLLDARTPAAKTEPASVEPLKESRNEPLGESKSY